MEIKIYGTPQEINEFLNDNYLGSVVLPYVEEYQEEPPRYADEYDECPYETADECPFVDYFSCPFWDNESLDCEKGIHKDWLRQRRAELAIKLARE